MGATVSTCSECYRAQAELAKLHASCQAAHDALRDVLAELAEAKRLVARIVVGSTPGIGWHVPAQLRDEVSAFCFTELTIARSSRKDTP